MTFSLHAVGRVDSYDRMRNGGIVFAIVERPDEKFVLLDDGMTGELKERYIPRIDRELPSLQPITEADEILARVINEKAYVIIYLDELFGISVYRLEYSPVPGYAMMTYNDPRRTEEERRELLQFTKFVVEHPDFYEAAYGKYVAIKNAQVVRELYRTPSDIEGFPKDDKIFCFRVGVMGIGKSRCFFRGKLNHPIDLEDAHFICHCPA